MTPTEHNEAVRLSIAMCTFNGGRFIRQQLDSILKQTLPPHELVICDDGSEDETLQILHEAVAESSIKLRIYVNANNLGFTRNFEQALALCTGDLIFMADQDDIWYPEKISTLCQLFHDRPELLGVTHDGRLVDEHGKWYGTMKQDQIYRGYGRQKPAVTGALTCIRRSMLNWMLPIPENIKGHDIWMSYLFSWFPEQWLLLKTSLGDIRRHSSNTSDWVVNSFKPISKVDVFKAQMRTSVAKNYGDRLAMNACLLQRLQDGDAIPWGLQRGHIDKVLNRLGQERLAILKRQAIADHPLRGLRWVFAIRLLAQGGYQHFNGLRSFLRDIVR